MNNKEKIKTRTLAIELLVKNTDNLTTKCLALIFNVSYTHMHKIIRGINNIHRQDSTLYYGERL